MRTSRAMRGEGSTATRLAPAGSVAARDACETVTPCVFSEPRSAVAACAAGCRYAYGREYETRLLLTDSADIGGQSRQYEGVQYGPRAPLSDTHPAPPTPSPH